MTEAAATQGTARVLATIPNRAVAGGAPFLLLRDDAGRYAVGQKIGDIVSLTSDWVGMAAIVSAAELVLAGDHRAIPHPKVLLHLAVAICGISCEAQMARAEAEKAK